MSEQNEEITLAHDEYIEANGINVNELPKDLDAELDAVNELIDAYEADPSDANFDKTEAASKALAGKIKSWHEAKSAPKPAEQPKEEPKPVAKETPPAPAPTHTPPAPAAKEEEGEDDDDSWSYTKYLK